MRKVIVSMTFIAPPWATMVTTLDAIASTTSGAFSSKIRTTKVRQMLLRHRCACTRRLRRQPAPRGHSRSNGQ